MTGCDTCRFDKKSYEESPCDDCTFGNSYYSACITREEAIALLNNLRAFAEDDDEPAIDMAIEVLQAKTVDCTNFVRWLMDEVMDEENWEMNAVANGEIICRKMKKLGLLDVVDGYYVETHMDDGMWETKEAEPTVIRSRTLMPTKDFKEWAKRVREENPNAIVIPCDAEVVSVEPKTGEWIQKDLCADRFCSCCDYVVWDSEAEEYNYCPNCGAKMEGGNSE